MTAVTATRADGSAALDDLDQRIRLDGAHWADYERLLAVRGERRVPRITYLQGELELMSPSERHEVVAETIGLLLMVWAIERRVPLRARGTTTWKDRGSGHGAEADKCFVLGPDAKARPDLAIEVVVTSGGIDKLEVYRGLGVPEVWFWANSRIRVHVLRGKRYQDADRSACCRTWTSSCWRGSPSVPIRRARHACCSASCAAADLLACPSCFLCRRSAPAAEPSRRDPMRRTSFLCCRWEAAVG